MCPGSRVLSCFALWYCYRYMADCGADCPTSERATYRRPRVTVVDDNPQVRETIGALLSTDYACAVYPSAEAFLESDDLHATACLILDVEMPGLNGFELRLRLRAMNCWVPIIFITANETLRSEALRERASSFLPKPFTVSDLLGSLDYVLTSERRTS